MPLLTDSRLSCRMRKHLTYGLSIEVSHPRQMLLNLKYVKKLSSSRKKYTKQGAQN